TSAQLNQRRIDHITEAIRTATAEAGHPIPASMDEFTVDVGDNISWIPVDDADRQRKQKLWPTYMSGGQIEFILEGFLEVDSFKKPEADALWDYTWYARSFMQENLPFHQMQPMDERVSNESTLTVGEGDGVTSEMGAQVFAKPGEIYAVYYPASESTGSIDLTDMSGEVTMQWFNPRTGEFEGEVITSEGGTEVEPGSVPSDPGEDWVLLIN
ncbi:MAG: putative collagen-binding domain-containing protein, partial [Balneolaceae bacterium]|nr:putative collagen-binding domain-containing protein [Balneolaceae bacterium]